jgi:DNA-binding transcriptional regulator YhcF (GntR family)
MSHNINPTTGKRIQDLTDEEIINMKSIFGDLVTGKMIEERKRLRIKDRVKKINKIRKV